MPEKIPFHELALAAYCPRKLYYVRREDRDPPPEFERALALSRRYRDLLLASDAALETFPIAVSAERFRANLGYVRDRFACWPALADPEETDVLLDGRECRGLVAKVLDTALDDSLVPTLVSPGEPPEQGVWEPQTVRAVAAAKALSWREQTPVDRALVEYPFHGVVREVPLTTRKKAQYRLAVRAARAVDGPPARLSNSNKCESCEFAAECGVKTRSLRSLL